MSLELAIQQNTAAINSLIEILSKGLGATIVSPDALEEQVLEQPKETKTKKTKAEKVEAKAEEPAAPAAEVKAPTYDDASAAVVAVASKLGRAKALEILGRAKDGAKSLKEVDPADYAAVIAACELALA